MFSRVLTNCELVDAAVDGIYSRCDLLPIVIFDWIGTVEFAEFLQMMTGKMGEKETREDIEKVFKLFDDDNTNKISFRNLARVAEELGENIDDEELQDMINQADRGDGEININEFYRIMKKGNFLEICPPMVTSNLFVQMCVSVSMQPAI